MAAPKVTIMMSDYGHDPTGKLTGTKPGEPLTSGGGCVGSSADSPCYTETAGPYTAFKAAGFEVSFVTENGKAPECDKRMLQGVTQKLLV